MSDFRAKIDRLQYVPDYEDGTEYRRGWEEALRMVLRLIPEGAVLALPGDTIISAEDAEDGAWVTKDDLDVFTEVASIAAVSYEGDPWFAKAAGIHDVEATFERHDAILRHIREAATAMEGVLRG